MPAKRKLSQQSSTGFSTPAPIRLLPPPILPPSQRTNSFHPSSSFSFSPPTSSCPSPSSSTAVVVQPGATSPYLLGHLLPQQPFIEGPQLRPGGALDKKTRLRLRATAPTWREGTRLLLAKLDANRQEEAEKRRRRNSVPASRGTGRTRRTRQQQQHVYLGGGGDCLMTPETSSRVSSCASSSSPSSPATPQCAPPKNVPKVAFTKKRVPAADNPLSLWAGSGPRFRNIDYMRGVGLAPLDYRWKYIHNKGRKRLGEDKQDSLQTAAQAEPPPPPVAADQQEEGRMNEENKIAEEGPTPNATPSPEPPQVEVLNELNREGAAMMVEADDGGREGKLAEVETHDSVSTTTNAPTISPPPLPAVTTTTHPPVPLKAAIISSPCVGCPRRPCRSLTSPGFHEGSNSCSALFPPFRYNNDRTQLAPTANTPLYKQEVRGAARLPSHRLGVPPPPLVCVVEEIAAPNTMWSSWSSRRLDVAEEVVSLQREMLTAFENEFNVDIHINSIHGDHHPTFSLQQQQAKQRTQKVGKQLKQPESKSSKLAGGGGAFPLPSAIVSSSGHNKGHPPRPPLPFTVRPRPTGPPTHLRGSVLRRLVVSMFNGLPFAALSPPLPIAHCDTGQPVVYNHRWSHWLQQPPAEPRRLKLMWFRHANKDDRMTDKKNESGGKKRGRKTSTAGSGRAAAVAAANRDVRATITGAQQRNERGAGRAATSATTTTSVHTDNDTNMRGGGSSSRKKPMGRRELGCKASNTDVSLPNDLDSPATSEHDPLTSPSDVPEEDDGMTATEALKRLHAESSCPITPLRELLDELELPSDLRSRCEEAGQLTASVPNFAALAAAKLPVHALSGGGGLAGLRVGQARYFSQEVWLWKLVQTMPYWNWEDGKNL
eukprot:GHVS01080886.1.p1 GENE.GHVS01080886.1~~GHVS01080886.1.p1  ORF type:complete len:883 (-),score=222.50 GHVS01080886.1:506-3154(-)